ncbi:MAG: leucyl/phenylalanyl-tRNA--protein transferase [Bacteroidales bacterium]|nr:leucyl/phenylalanyl-tRNA--protein transferase [Bacteroidales bacterium]
MPVYLLDDEDCGFPDVEQATQEGLLAIGGDLSPERLINAYASGIFPWYSEGEPIMWWSPDPRMLLYPEKFKASKSLLQTIRNKKYQLCFDRDFETVIQHCANVKREHEEGTWITDEMIQAYVELHKMGIAHSVETYMDGRLVGGLYGISLGKAFFGESMFFLERDASKAAFYHLVEFSKKMNFSFIDTQIETNHLESMGAEKILRKDFINLLNQSLESNTLNFNWNDSDNNQLH